MGVKSKGRRLGQWQGREDFSSINEKVPPVLTWKLPLGNTEKERV